MILTHPLRNRIVKSCKQNLLEAEPNSNKPAHLEHTNTHTDKKRKMLLFVLCNDFRLPFSETHGYYLAYNVVVSLHSIECKLND